MITDSNELCKTLFQPCLDTGAYSRIPFVFGAKRNSVQAMPLYPLFLKLEGRRCVVIGGGKVATRKVQSLIECGARVLVVSPELCPELEKRASAGEIDVVRRGFEPDDIRGAVVAIAATSLRSVNETVVEAGRAIGVLVNVVDVPGLCDFYVPSSFERGDLQIAVSTGGAFPALAKKLRIALEAQFGPEYQAYLELLTRFREQVKARIADSHRRAEAENAFLELPVFDLLAEGKREEAESALGQCLSRFCS